MRMDEIELEIRSLRAKLDLLIVQEANLSLRRLFGGQIGYSASIEHWTQLDMMQANTHDQDGMLPLLSRNDTRLCEAGRTAMHSQTWRHQYARFRCSTVIQGGRSVLVFDPFLCQKHQDKWLLAPLSFSSIRLKAQKVCLMENLS